MISELKEMELEELIGTILENGIEEHGFMNKAAGVIPSVILEECLW